MTQITITRLGHRGDGIGTGPEGGPVYVARTLPGEVVSGVVEGDRIATPSIVTPSSDRVTAPCAHYRSCGGCALMHASDRFQANWKSGVITMALRAQGLDAPIRAIATSPPWSRRRATLAGRRTKKGALVGFHARRSDTIVPITECHVLTPELLAVVPVLGEITRLGGSRAGVLSFALTLSESGVDLHVTGGKPLDGPLRVALGGFARSFVRLTWADEPVFAETAAIIRFGRVAVSPPPGAFLQATEHGEAALLTAVTEAIAGATRIVDLFAGCGTFSLPLSEVMPVHAVEGDGALVDALQKGARHAEGLKPLTTETRDLFRRPMLASELAAYDAIVIDPPRAGAEAQMNEIAEARVPRIAAISCNPVTFARDAAVLTRAGYRLNWVQPVDQFLWSSHVELAASLSLAHIDA